MTTPCKITLLETPFSLNLEDLDGSHLDIFFALIIVNPYGPTISFIAAAGEPTNGANLPILNVMLNPFKQNVTQIGNFTVGNQWTPLVDMLPLINRDFGDCPTLILISNKLNEDERIALTHNILEEFGDQAVSIFRKVLKHYGNPWDRISNEIAGVEYEIGELKVANIAKELAVMILSPDHIGPELQALSAAWEGSIDKTGISESLKNSAMSADAFKQFLFERVIPSLWLPELSESQLEKPKNTAPERLKIESLDELNSVLESERWKKFQEDQLADLFRFTSYVYGQNGDINYIKWLSAIYRQMLAIGIDDETRLLLEIELSSLVNQKKAISVVFLPFLVEDTSQQVASKALIDFVSTSGFINDELYAFTELRSLFKHNTLSNPGAVFGALIAMGDDKAINFAKEFINDLTLDEVKVACKVHTDFINHPSVQFWIWWSKLLIEKSDNESQAKLGNCASALILTLHYGKQGRVVYGNRNYPCQANDESIIKKGEWTIDEYAETIAKDLYELEAIETAPKLFSDVLRAWGLMPHAKLTEQYIPDSGHHENNKKLRELAPFMDGDVNRSSIDRYLNNGSHKLAKDITKN
jgi:hypothetical protein